MRRAFFLLLFVAFISLATAQEQVEPKLVGSGVFTVQFNWTVDFNGQQPNSASFTTFAFFNNPHQEVSFSTSTPYVSSVDSLGNTLLNFNLDPSKQQQVITLDAIVSSQSQGDFDPVVGSVDKFMQASEYAIITPQISAKASELVGSEVNPLKKATILSSWVHNNVEYDLAYKDVILDSQRVFEIRRGVCNEYGHLLIAMLRSVNVPSRFAAGLVYSGEIWAPHAWVEVAVNGKWYPFDPTYNEGIFLDATHIKFANGVDQANVTEQFSAVGNLDLSAVSLTRSHEVSINSHAGFSTTPIVNIFVTNESVEPGSIQNITVSIESIYPDVMTYPVSLDVPPEVKILSQKTTLLMFFPGEKKLFSWQVIIPSNLSEGFIYTYPVVIRSLGVKVQSVLKAERKGIGTSEVQLLQISEVRLNNRDLVVSIHNRGNTVFQNAVSTVELPFGNFSKTFSLQAGGDADINFELTNLNISTDITGIITLTSENYSLSQQFLLKPATNSAPIRPAFNIPVGKSIVVRENLLETYGEFIPYGAAAIVLIFILSIIVIKVRS
ncbi:MAG: transglutaminase domain-containing protein [Candidatus Micrarchaeota archaeon]|nr:transglutaminase domain-containing protein [Candidatus Micrarchaeota archaeon]